MNLLREKQRTQGWHARCSDGPDMSGVNEAAKANADIGKEALDWYKQQYADSAPAREKAAARADEVSAAQLASMNTQTGLAKEAADYNRETFRPLERQVVAEAENFDTEAERERLAGLALGDVNQAAASARDQTTRAATRMGVNPSDGAFAGTARNVQNSQMLAGADASTKARMNATTMGRAMKMDAISLGRGLPGQQATSAGLALSAGRGAVDSAQVPLNVAQSGAEMGGRGYSTAITANNSAGNLYGQVAQAEGNNDGLWGTIGSVAGKAAAMYMSDENEKTDRKPVGKDISLAAVRKMPVERWKYKKGSVADDGGREHVGPMAQTVNAALGDGVAPGGKQIDAISLAGITLAAVQDLDKKVTKLAKAPNR